MRENQTVHQRIRWVIGLVLGLQLVLASTLAWTPATAGAPPVTIAVVGDQNTAGIKNRVVWPTLMAARTGWSVSNYALPEAGFAADGMGGQAFRFQVERAQAQRPRLILVVTGTADASVAEMQAVTVGAVEAINKIIRGGEQAAVVGPFWYETPVPESVRRVDDAVRKAAEQTGVPYFDALDPPLFTRDQMHPDRSGPSDQGQSVAADKIATWLRTQVLK
ncbi:SGNH/GDSL hydrolase family protein [Mycolicibacterium goodii]|uniref:SGNH/GDSL hydrolase family protein n=1 Tax=Mycolicibacterium goodii TaxID=134601 RepID=A0ABS6HM12_MYCGD|nr:SGNH/GDSL hydrolase family protein [Mycolicibacterium goodii]MBU8823741.1 SGNH/GDSL hydrolase family protein [Mycolicibacterium goodii]MBU8833123.1 SGNH/GDSL hydrolase family protein [Mycolicibacterium goodii]MBU8835913.1 SGNH/GDSL hydrolase family protein [Mycolicibacterium goodii]